MSHTDGTAGLGSVSRLFKLEPAVIRGVLVGLTTIISAVVGKSIGTAWVENILFIYTAISPIVAGILIRGAVTPNAKVGTRVNDIIERIRRESGNLTQPPVE